MKLLRMFGIVLIVLFGVNLLIAAVAGTGWGINFRREPEPLLPIPESFSCPYCDIEFDSYEELYQHILDEHPQVQPQPPSAENLLTNPSVEDNANGDGMPDGWRSGFYEDVPHKFTWSNYTKRSGEKSLLIRIWRNDSAIGWHSAHWRQFFYFDDANCPLQRGKTYAFRCWFRMGGMDVVWLSAGFWNSTGNWITDGSVKIGLHHWEWSKSPLLIFTVPESAKYGAFGIVMHVGLISEGRDNGYCYADDFEMYEVSGLPALSVFDVTAGNLTINVLWFIVIGAAVAMIVYPSKEVKEVG